MDKLHQPVLVLNSSYVPISIRNVKDAICMLLMHRAQTIKSIENDFIRSEKLKIPTPTIILLMNYFLVPKKTFRPNRFNILERDGYACIYCQKKPPPSKLTIDHIIPKSRWNETPKNQKPNEFNSWENMVSCCRECNTKKGNQLLSEISWKPIEIQKLKPKTFQNLNINANIAQKYGWLEYLQSKK
jgi:5-methylcytosine-specific restriction endonuclease McrA